jgi:hypothetical protein
MAFWRKEKGNRVLVSRESISIAVTKTSAVSVLVNHYHLLRTLWIHRCLPKKVMIQTPAFPHL